MGKVQELKHAAKLQEWSTRVAECRSSGTAAFCGDQRPLMRFSTAGWRF